LPSLNYVWTKACNQFVSFVHRAHDQRLAGSRHIFLPPSFLTCQGHSFPLFCLLSEPERSWASVTYWLWVRSCARYPSYTDGPRVLPHPRASHGPSFFLTSSRGHSDMNLIETPEQRSPFMIPFFLSLFRTAPKRGGKSASTPSFFFRSVLRRNSPSHFPRPLK